MYLLLHFNEYWIGINVIIIAFNPIPFIRTFEGAVDKLISLRKDVQAKSEQMEKSVKVAEREYSKKMSDLNKGFEVCLFIPARDIFLTPSLGSWAVLLWYGK